MSRSIPFLALLWAFSVPASAQSGLAFLRIGPDAAGLALGDAGTAVADGPFVAERNPAGLADAAGTAFGLSHHVWIADVRTYAAAASFRAGERGGIGLYVRATGSGNLEARQFPGDPDGLFDAQFLVAGIAYGRSFGPVHAGLSVTYLSEKIFAVSADGVAADFGVRGFPVRGLRLAAAYLHAGSMDELEQRRTRLPRTVRGAVAIYPFRVLAMLDGTVLAEAFLTAEVSRNLVDEVTQWHIGASGHVLDTVQARIGYVVNDDLRGFSFGAGVGVARFQVDYALLPFDQGFEGPGHVFTMAYRL
jgi:hypothetical protein